MWFPFWIPEELLSGSLRLWFSPNAGQCGGTIAGWRGAGEGVFGERWVEDWAGPPDLRDLRLANGLHLRCTKPLEQYRIEHRGKNLELDLVFDAIMEPNPVAPEESPGMFAGHLEQPGRVTGEVRAYGVTRRVDCHAVRDRSWGPREMPSDIRLGNAHGTADGFAFFVYVRSDARGNEPITSGYLLRDGVAAHITGGERTTRWRDGVPIAVELTAEDAAGRELRVRGDCVNSMASNAGNGVYAILNLVGWKHADGVAWGENHDVWSEKAWLAAGREPL